MKFFLSISGVLACSLWGTSAAADQRYWLSPPVLQKFEFNGIEASFSTAIQPSAQPREMTDEQGKQYRAYFDLNDVCRGRRPGPKTDRACAARDAMNLRAYGLCYGMKDSQSMSDMEWHPCLPKSGEYEVGSEDVTFTCRPGGGQDIRFRLVDDRLAFSDESLLQEGVVRIPATKAEFAAEYFLSKSGGFKERVYHATFEFKSDASQILYQLYDGERIVFPLGADQVTLSAPLSLEKKILNEVARMYAACKQ